MGFSYQSGHSSNFAYELHQIWMFFVTTKKLRIDIESSHFPRFSEKSCKCNLTENRNGHGKLSNGHGKVIGKCFGKCVETQLIFFSSIKHVCC